MEGEEGVLDMVASLVGRPCRVVRVERLRVVGGEIARSVGGGGMVGPVVYGEPGDIMTGVGCVDWSELRPQSGSR